MLSKLSIDDIEEKIPDKRILMRVDYNINIKNGIIDPFKIEKTIPSIKYLLNKGALAIILISHMDNPNGKYDEKYSLKQIVKKIEYFLGKCVYFISDCIGNDVNDKISNIINENDGTQEGSVILLENLRFHSEEQGYIIDKNELIVKENINKITSFRNQLSSLGDIFVYDAFNISHLQDSSIIGINLNLKVAGLLMKNEMHMFYKLMHSPERPFVVIMGGKILNDKIKLIMNLLEIVDKIIFTGGIAFTFLRVTKNMNIGDTFYDKEGALYVNKILDKAAHKKVDIYLPIDFICAEKESGKSNRKICNIANGIEKGWYGCDIGPETSSLIENLIKNSKTVFWNGPPGIIEISHFQKGTIDLLNSLIKATNMGISTFAAGDDTVNCLSLVQGTESILTHISTGGRASLLLLEGQELPGIQNLSDKCI